MASTTLHPHPATSRRASRLADILERSLWTFVQAASATGMVAGWNALDLGPDLSPAWVGPIAFGLALIKTNLAAMRGNGSAATLPDAVEPVPAARVVAQETTAGLVVAGHGHIDDGTGENIPAGTPLEVNPADLGAARDDNLPDIGEDPDNTGLAMPDDFDDGSSHGR